MESFKEVIARWGTVAEFASDLGVPTTTAYSWHQRPGGIPHEWCGAVVRAAHARGFHDITPELLATLAERVRLQRRGQAPGQAHGAAA